MAGRRGGQLMSGGRRWALIGFTVAGVFAHVTYLAGRASGAVTPLSSPAEWCLIAASVLAAVYLTMTVTNSRVAVGLFLLPVILALLGLSQLASEEPFAQEQASKTWGLAHGWLLVAATASMSVGFVAGLMYLVQSWRLRRGLPPSAGFALPSLEWLEKANARSLALSVWFTVGGFVSGLVLTRLQPGEMRPVELLWDPIVLTTTAMLGWLVVAAGFQRVYPPARSGRKVAYLTVTAFGFLMIVLASLALRGPVHGVASIQHGESPQTEPESPVQPAPSG